MRFQAVTEDARSRKMAGRARISGAARRNARQASMETLVRGFWFVDPEATCKAVATYANTMDTRKGGSMDRILVHGREVSGLGIDAETRCAHYASDRDVLAIRFPCCHRYYACFSCHQALAGHPAARWSAERFDVRALLCGVCGYEMTIREYLAAEHRCPACRAAMNPRCAEHHSLYFAL